jgi:hypothetical protein
MEKWSEDIEPISMMEEAWFRVKGIPMKFRNNSIALYAASLVGKHLALDKRAFYFRALGSLVVLSCPQPLSFSSVLP